MNECTLLNNIMMTEGREEEEGKKNCVVMVGDVKIVTNNIHITNLKNVVVTWT